MSAHVLAGVPPGRPRPTDAGAGPAKAEVEDISGKLEDREFTKKTVTAVETKAIHSCSFVD